MARQVDLLSVDEARRKILSRFERLELESVPLNEAAGRVLAGDVVSPRSIPPFANSSMDGFALRHSDTGNGRAELTLVSTVLAGESSSVTVGAGQCARIMTGAPIPPGADAVVPFEDVEDRGETVVVSTPVQPGACIRPAGQDVRDGHQVLDAGTELGATQVALLAALGFGQVDVIRRPRVGVLSTGDELVLPGNALGPGQIYNSNSPMLATAIAEAGAESVLLPPVSDIPEHIERALRSLEHCDLILTSGGASVGDRDYIKDVLETHGELGFWRVRVRPGKPLLLGRFEAVPLIGLPGNPTSAMVTFELFARPAIRTMLGASVRRPEIVAIVDSQIDNRGGRETYARVGLSYHDGRYHAVLAGPQDSAMLVPLAHADGLLRIPAEVAALQPGEEAPVQVWRLPSTP